VEARAMRSSLLQSKSVPKQLWFQLQKHSDAKSAVHINAGQFVRLFFYLVCEATGPAATPGLLCQPRVIVKTIVEKQMECRLAGETEVLGENLPQLHFCPSKNPT
jgi:hypothetical protein